MECPGQYLKRERELRGISLEDISTSIKVPLRSLKALEVDNYEALPHPTFVKGFIKAYCKHIGIDENDAVLRFELYLQEVADFENKPQKLQPKIENIENDAEDKASIFTDRKIVLAAIGAVVIILIAVFFLLVREPSEDLLSVKKPPAVDAAATSAKASPTAKKTQKAAKKAALVAVKKAGPKPTDSAKPSVALSETTKKPAPEVKAPPKKSDEKLKEKAKAEVEKAEAEGKPVAPAEKTEEAAVGSSVLEKLGLKKSAAPEAGHTLSAHAVELTWMRLTIDNGTPREVMLRPGEEVKWVAKDLFLLHIGNAAGVELTFNGKSLGTLGAKGKTVKLRLPPES